MLKLVQEGCEICGDHRTQFFVLWELTERRKIPFSTTSVHTGVKTVENLDGFDFAFTTTNQNKPDGSMYLYKMGADLGQKNFCSLKCAYDYSKSKNVLVVYPDPNNPDQLRGITPDIIEINYSLGNQESVKYRGQPVGN